MDQEPPPWLNEEFLAAALQGGENKEPRVKVLRFKASEAVAAGNNYLSHLFRVRVDYEDVEERTISLIIKAPLTTGTLTEVADKMDFYSKEPKMYGELLSKLNKKVGMEFGAKQFYCSLKNGLVFSDLMQEGFVMCDKYKQFDFQHCELALRTLAKFHAASVACHKDNPELVEKIGTETVFVEGKTLEEEMKPWVESRVKAVAEILQEAKEADTAQFVLDRADTVIDSVLRLCYPKKSGLKVLNHGDFWMNNIMFKHDDQGRAVDIKLVDFQILRFVTPAMDFIYFICTSPNEDVRESRLQELTECYLETLNDTLEYLGLEERLQAEEFLGDLRQGVEWMLIICCCFLPMILSDPPGDDVEKVDPVDPKAGVPDGKLYKSVLPNLIRQMRIWLTSI